MQEHDRFLDPDGWFGHGFKFVDLTRENLKGLCRSFSDVPEFITSLERAAETYLLEIEAPPNKDVRWAGKTDRWAGETIPESIVNARLEEIADASDAFIESIARAFDRNTDEDRARDEHGDAAGEEAAVRLHASLKALGWENFVRDLRNAHQILQSGIDGAVGQDYAQRRYVCLQPREPTAEELAATNAALDGITRLRRRLRARGFVERSGTHNEDVVIQPARRRFANSPPERDDLDNSSGGAPRKEARERLVKEIIERAGKLQPTRVKKIRARVPGENLP